MRDDQDDLDFGNDLDVAPVSYTETDIGPMLARTWRRWVVQINIVPNYDQQPFVAYWEEVTKTCKWFERMPAHRLQTNLTHWFVVSQEEAMKYEDFLFDRKYPDDFGEWPIDVTFYRPDGKVMEDRNDFLLTFE